MNNQMLLKVNRQWKVTAKTRKFEEKRKCKNLNKNN